MFDTPDVVEEKQKKLRKYSQLRFSFTIHCSGDGAPMKPGKQTFFVSASIQAPEVNSFQLPWVVDIELPRSQMISKDKQRLTKK